MMDNGDYPDKLIVKDLGPRLDGEYPCDVVGMLLEGSPQTLTNREGHQIKVQTGVRAGELWDSMQAGDNDVLVAMAAIILQRAGKNVDMDILWDAPMGSALQLDVAERDEKEEEEDDASPTTTPATKPPGSDGGPTSSPVTLVDPASDLSPTGTPDSEPLAFDQPTLAS